MPNLHTPDQFKTRKALIGMGVLGIILAYFLATRAIDTASWWQYFGTLALLIVGIRLIFRGVKAKS